MHDSNTMPFGWSFRDGLEALHGSRARAGLTDLLGVDLYEVLYQGCSYRLRLGHFARFRIMAMQRQEGS